MGGRRIPFVQKKSFSLFDCQHPLPRGNKNDAKAREETTKKSAVVVVASSVQKEEHLPFGIRLREREREREREKKALSK